MQTLRSVAAAIALVAALAWAAWVATGSARSESDPVRQEMTVRVMAGEGWRVADQNTAPGVLVFGVEVDDSVRSDDVARQIVGQTGAAQDEILMYFYRRGALGARAFERIQWIPSHGYSRLRF
jgi:hypothetical protein